jgi:hypothetical protein
MMEQKEKMKFREWCELNGRRWEWANTYEEFEKNAKDYEAYLASTAIEQDHEINIHYPVQRGE